MKERKRKAEKPSFDETALAQLTSKLDKSLGNSEKERPPKRKRQRDNDDEHEPKRHQSKPSERGPQGELGGGRKAKQAPNLLDEILALGGNEEDLELVANVDSGDEGGDAPRSKSSSETVVDKSLKDELAQFASSLGLSKFHEHEDPETDEDTDEPEDETNESEEEPAVVEEHNAPAPPPQEARQAKKSGNLVSKQVVGGVSHR
jgi:ribosome biogenesis protein MAK21